MLWNGSENSSRRSSRGEATRLPLITYLPVGDVPLVDAQRESTLWIVTRPGLEQHRGALLAVIGEWDQHTHLTLLALRPIHRHLLRPYRDSSRCPAQDRGVEGNRTIRGNQALVLRRRGQPINAPARNRTWTSGSGDLRDILFTTGATHLSARACIYHRRTDWSIFPAPTAPAHAALPDAQVGLDSVR